MLVLTDEPRSHNAAWETLDNAFGTEEFSREQAMSVLVQAGVQDEYGNLDRLVRDGYVSEV